MPSTHPTNWSVFKILCRVLGGRDNCALADGIANGLLSRLADMAQYNGMLSALAVRYNEQFPDTPARDQSIKIRLTQALHDNTIRNMQISAQALKLTEQLNRADITPLFLKGTVQLLTTDSECLGFRHQVDIDLLVRPEQLATAADVLQCDGYTFCDFSIDSHIASTPPRNTAIAIKQSAAHHHLPPLIKSSYAVTVELHRHFLPKRFQRNNTLDPLFNTANQHERQNARFLTPSDEYQMIHLILGKLVHDGHLARRTMPLREACDYIKLMEHTKGVFDYALVKKHCGNRFVIFAALVEELMAYATISTNKNSYQHNIKKRLKIMQGRYNSPALGTLLDGYARALHLGHSLAYSPAKLPAYLNRLNPSR